MQRQIWVILLLNLSKKNNIKIQIDKRPLKIINTLQNAGFEAYVVGGCVRDSLMGLIPNDWDIATDAGTNDIKRLFDRCFDTGIKHGTVTVLADGMPIEVTTYRIDVEYKDYRHPFKVEFTKKLEEDLKRRDFTINAMAYNPDVGLVDLFNGISDLEKGIVRTVGNADKRFKEDALRILRCVRFALHFGFTISDTTYEALKRNASLLNNIAYERIREEFNKILLSDGNLKLLYDTGILRQVLPELDSCFKSPLGDNNNQTLGEHMLLAAHIVKKELVLKWAALLHDIGRQESLGDNNKVISSILNRFKFDNKSRSIILKLIKYNSIEIEPAPKIIKTNIKNMGKDIFLLLLELKKADISAGNIEHKEYQLEKLKDIKKIYSRIKSDPVQLKDLAIKGNDLIEIGFEGKQIGFILDKLLDHVIENPQSNQKETLILIAKEFAGEI